MPCYHPLTAWRAKDVNASGKRSLVFRADLGFGDSLQISCQRCIGCKLEYARQWAIRMMHESQLHLENCFVTLTLEDDNLVQPYWTGLYNDGGGKVYGGTLVKKHWQDFMKRFRKFMSGERVSYYHCGEYGTRFRRPHYHACIFGADFPDRKFYKERDGIKLYTSAALDRLWGLGLCTVGSVTFESAAYCARYVCERVTGEVADSYYQVVDYDTGEVLRVEPEYATMSLRPAIGKDWYAKFGKGVQKSDSVVMRGFEMKPPKYYDRIFQLQDPVSYEAVKLERRRGAVRGSADSTWERLQVREEVKRAQVNFLKREVS